MQHSKELINLSFELQCLRRILRKAMERVTHLSSPEPSSQRAKAGTDRALETPHSALSFHRGKISKNTGNGTPHPGAKAEPVTP